MNLVLYPDRNAMQIDGQHVVGHHRWEAAFVLLLVRASAGTAGCLHAAVLDQALQDAAGQKPMGRRQRSRLLDGVQAMFAQAGAATALAQRLVITPRQATVGPWCWRAWPGDTVQAEPDGWPMARVAQAHDRPPGFAAAGGLAAASRLCRAVLVAQALLHEGNLGAAASHLGTEAAWSGESPELAAWRWCRLAEALWKQRDQPAALAAITQAEQLVRQHRTAARMLGDAVALLRPRLAYALDPVGRAAEALQQLQALAVGERQQDRLAQGLALNQMALCQRRLGEQALHDGDAQRGQHLLHAAIDGHLGATFCFATAEHAVLAQSATANLAHLLGLMFAQESQVTIADVLDWHALSQAWHSRFDLPDASVWESVFLGDLWLYNRRGRAAFDSLGTRASWEGVLPDNPGFYARAVQRAHEIGDPRQLAHALLNQRSFLQASAMAEAATRAEAALQSVLAEHPELARLMTAEGYTLPAASPQPQGRPAHAE